ncbi:hypothetical protein RZ532_22140 [Nitratireductor aquimarinus]|uniref:hypothetical protein n=1 Tax=Nitratireductor aquimarinus TaxID=889300 RepID=UPI002935DEDE|nr:hypothetical protein [Nitratireductor aquimarinus]MDV2968692.1 hypothetical protein [Nitratireductor aquimarinus]
MSENKGYTLNGIVGRIRDLETKTNGSYYVALCWLAMARNSGKGARKLLEGKIFGQDKPTSTFRNAWRIADKSFAEGFHVGHREKAGDMLIDDAIEFAVNCLEAHKTALGVTNMKDYEENCRYASKADMPETAAEPEAEAEPQPEAEPVETLADAKEQPERDLLADFSELVTAMELDELMQAAQLIANRIADLSETEQLQIAA